MTLLTCEGSRPGRAVLQQGTEVAAICRARIYLLAVVAHGLAVAFAEAAVPSDLPERENKEVRRPMRLTGLEAIYQARRTSQPHPEDRVYPYRLKSLTIERRDHVW